MQTQTIPLDSNIANLVPEIQKWLEDGEVVILPTDTTYAMVAHAYKPEAIRKIQTLKQAEIQQPMAVFTTKDKASELGTVSESCRRLMEIWPEAVSFLIPHNHEFPDEVTAGSNSLLIICPDRFMETLVQELPFPIVGVAAGVSSLLPVRNAEHANQHFQGKVPLIVDGGQSKYDMGGTLVDCTVDVPVTLKFGPISVDELKKFDSQVHLASHLMK